MVFRKIFSYKTYWLLTFFLIFTGCNRLSEEELKQVVNSNHKIFYLEHNSEEGGLTLRSSNSERNYDLMIYDLESSNNLSLGKKIFSRSFPKLSPNGRLIAFSAPDIPRRAVFSIYNFELNTERRVGKNLPSSELGVIGVRFADFLNDTTLIFSIEGKLFKFQFTIDSLSQLVSFNNKFITDMAVKPGGEIIALAVGNSRLQLSNNELFIFDHQNDSTINTQLTVSLFDGWDLGGRKLTVRDSSGMILHYSNGLFFRGEPIIFPDSFWFETFIDDRNILLRGKDISDGVFEDFFLYDIIDRKVTKRLTTNGYTKSYIGRYYSK